MMQPVGALLAERGRTDGWMAVVVVVVAVVVEVEIEMTWASGCPVLTLCCQTPPLSSLPHDHGTIA